MHVVDEFAREALAIECHRCIDADKTVTTLERLAAGRATAPAFIRCDNGPELTSNALEDWCRFSRARSAYIEPGSPWQNPYVESFGSRVRDELLSIELFSCLAEARVLIEDWRQDYNEQRPHSALGMISPTRFAIGYREAHRAAARAGDLTLRTTTIHQLSTSSHSRWTDERLPVTTADVRSYPNASRGPPSKSDTRSESLSRTRVETSGSLAPSAPQSRVPPLRRVPLWTRLSSRIRATRVLPSRAGGAFTESAASRAFQRSRRPAASAGRP